MLRYLMPDGTEEVEGETYAEVVAAMNDTKMTPSTNLTTYRNALAGRVMQVYPNAAIDPSTDESLIMSLMAAGIIERL